MAAYAHLVLKYWAVSLKEAIIYQLYASSSQIKEANQFFPYAGLNVTFCLPQVR